MPKAKTTKRTTKKVAEAKEMTEVVQNPTALPAYHLKISLNDKVFDIDTDDLRSAIHSVKPEFLRTKIIMWITKDGRTVERLLYLRKGEALFRNKYAMDFLINNLNL